MIHELSDLFDFIQGVAVNENKFQRTYIQRYLKLRVCKTRMMMMFRHPNRTKLFNSGQVLRSDSSSRRKIVVQGRRPGTIYFLPCFCENQVQSTPLSSAALGFHIYHTYQYYTTLHHDHHLTSAQSPISSWWILRPRASKWSLARNRLLHQSGCWWRSISKTVKWTLGNYYNYSGSKLLRPLTGPADWALIGGDTSVT